MVHSTVMEFTLREMAGGHFPEMMFEELARVHGPPRGETSKRGCVQCSD
jgi:hypothetical protein